MNSNDVTDVFKGIFTGEDKYIAGLLVILANVVGFVTHFKKFDHSPVVTYGILTLIILIGSLLAHL